MAKEKDGEVLPLVVPVNEYLKQTQREKDDLEWDGCFEKSQMLQQTIDELIELRDKGEVWYPLF